MGDSHPGSLAQIPQPHEPSGRSDRHRRPQSLQRGPENAPPHQLTLGPTRLGKQTARSG